MSRLPKGLWATRSITLQAGYPLSIFGIFLSSIGYPDELQYYLGQPVGAHMENQLRVRFEVDSLRDARPPMETTRKLKCLGWRSISQLAFTRFDDQLLDLLRPERADSVPEPAWRSYMRAGGKFPGVLR
ncbi:hypothetical protein CC2G_005164 [Coprinopsis cinerea AmutBmut pab1-1]|nr:hypothetical protein CC2G_005164 [Coprinopsis cinerea AmutBmut pab1-1]